MGLFTKWHTCACICCGEQYESYRPEKGRLCPNCMEARGWKGYVELREDIDETLPPYTMEEWNYIDARREVLLNMCRRSEGITFEELENARCNYMHYTDKECIAFINKFKNVKQKIIPRSLGGFLTVGYIMPAAYPGVVVNPGDVFAIAFGAPYWNGRPNGDVVSIGFLTNDPAAPMFALGAVFEGGLFKNKKKREELKEKLKIVCPNLAYPIMDYKELKNIIKKEGTVKGNISKEIVLKYIDRIDTTTAPFRMSDVFDSCNNKEILNRYGYIYEDQLQYFFQDRKIKAFLEDKMKTLPSNRG